MFYRRQNAKVFSGAVQINSQKYQRFEPLCIKFGNIGVRKFKFEEGVHCSVP